MEIPQADTTNELYLTEEAKQHLLEGRKWMKFIAILGFIGIGFMVLAGLIYGFAFGALFGSIPNIPTLPFDMSYVGIFISLFYLAMAALMTPPIYHLYKFTDNIKSAILTNNTSLLTDAMSNLKSRYKFIGIMIIVVIVIYILSFIGMFLGMAAFI